ncbi:MAG: glycosyltransferase family 39 protein [Deltaproteobacteria bacterium]|nr:glycosyltransferase family 39 protein [Deltaproteobacteria bacterium]
MEAPRRTPSFFSRGFLLDEQFETRCLLAGLGFLAVLNLAVALTNRAPLTVIDSHILSFSSKAAMSIVNGENPFLKSYYNYPPLFFCVNGLLLAVGVPYGRSAVTLLATFWMAWGTAGLFLLVRDVWDRRTAIFVTMLWLATPAAAVGLRVVNIDHGHMALLPWFIWAVHRSAFLDRWGWAAAAGSLLGAGFLVRWNFPFVVALPVAVLAAAALRGATPRRVAGLLFFTAPAAVAALLLFFLHRKGITVTPDLGGGLERDFPQFWAADSLLFYPRVIYHFLLGPWLIWLIAGGLVDALRRDGPGTIWPILTVAGALVFSFGRRVKIVYFFALVPMLIAWAAPLFAASRTAVRLLIAAAVLLSVTPHSPDVPPIRDRHLAGYGQYLGTVHFADSGLPPINLFSARRCPGAGRSAS